MAKYRYTTECKENGRVICSNNYNSLNEQIIDFKRLVRMVFDEQTYPNQHISETLNNYRKALRKKYCSKNKFSYRWGFGIDDGFEVKLNRIGVKNEN